MGAIVQYTKAQRESRFPLALTGGELGTSSKARIMTTWLLPILPLTLKISAQNSPASRVELIWAPAHAGLGAEMRQPTKSLEDSI